MLTSDPFRRSVLSVLSADVRSETTPTTVRRRETLGTLLHSISNFTGPNQQTKPRGAQYCGGRQGLYCVMSCRAFGGFPCSIELPLFPDIRFTPTPDLNRGVALARRVRAPCVPWLKRPAGKQASERASKRECFDTGQATNQLKVRNPLSTRVPRIGSNCTAVLALLNSSSEFNQAQMLTEYNIP